MTQQQVSEYQRALARAHRAGLFIAGRGTWKSDGARFVAVSSASEANRAHLVTIRGGRLICDCMAGLHQRYCTHRALAREDLERQREQQQQRRRVATVDAAARRETAPMVQRPAFSIWASDH